MNKKLLFCILLMTMLIGCETTGDPKKGGLFGWSEKKAVQRKDELKGILSYEGEQGQILKTTSKQLDHDKAAKAAELEEQKIRLSSLDADLNKIRKDISRVEAKTTAKKDEKRRAEQELAKLEREIKSVKALKSSDQISIQKKKERIDQLNKDIDKLLNLIKNL